MSTPFDWHEVALGAIALIILIAGWVWTSTTRRMEKLGDVLGKLFDKFADHEKHDDQRFTEITEKMTDYHIETLNRISGRWKDGDR